MDTCVQIEDAAHLLDRRRHRLGGVTGPYNQFRVDAVEMGAGVFDDAVIAFLRRAIAFNRNDRVSVDAGSNRDGDERLEHRVRGVHVVESRGYRERSSQHIGMAELRQLHAYFR